MSERLDQRIDLAVGVIIKQAGVTEPWPDGDTRSSRDGEVIERLGSYDPLGKVEEQQVQFDAGRVEYWLSVGAQPTLTVERLLKKKGIKVSDVRAKVKAAAKAKTEGQEPKPKA